MSGLFRLSILSFIVKINQRYSERKEGFLSNHLKITEGDLLKRTEIGVWPEREKELDAIRGQLALVQFVFPTGGISVILAEPNMPGRGLPPGAVIGIDYRYLVESYFKNLGPTQNAPPPSPPQASRIILPSGYNSSSGRRRLYGLP